MHYMFESESKLRAFLHNVSVKLEPGGIFIGTTIDSDRIVAKLRANKDNSNMIGNKFYQIKFGQLAYPKDHGPFG